MFETSGFQTALPKSKVSPGDTSPLAVVVLNWNGRHDLEDCLRSLRDSGYVGLRVLMVDNGSEDDSVVWTRKHHPEVEIIETGQNLRWAGGNNVALRKLQEEKFAGKILLLNNDTIVPQGSLERLVGAFDEDPEAWAATPRICYAHDPARVWYDGGRIGRYSGWVRHHGIRQVAGKLEPGPRYVEYGTGCALLLDPRVLHEVGELDEQYFLYGEDADYSLRITEAGGRILHVPRALVLHKVSASLGANTPQKLRLRSRSHIRLLRQHWPPSRWLFLFFGQAVFLGGHSVYHLWHGRPEAAFAVLQGALDQLRERSQ
ncbi:MAG: glycosyltransferase family 2 protein [Gemmatimonadales bacterium]|nr:glycosyltransferase family 2 protein [Gemmatimonadales bacterium]